MIKIFGSKSRDTILLEKDSLNHNFRNKDYIFININSLMPKEISKKYNKFLKKNKKVILMINNYKSNFDIKKLINFLEDKKFDISLILPLYENKKVKIKKIIFFVKGNIYKINFYILNPDKKTFLQRVWNYRNNYP